MKTEQCTLVIIFMSTVSRCQDDFRCSLNSPFEKKNIPDIIQLAPEFFQMEVEHTIVNLNRTNYYINYFDEFSNKGRVDILHEGKTTKYYYFGQQMEAFEITDTTCTEYNMSTVPEFMSGFVYDWDFDAVDPEGRRLIVHGPSAMLEYAMMSQHINPDSVRYMGNSTEDVRGMRAHYWRRCVRENLTADFYFSAGHEDLYGVQNLTDIPVRVVFYGIDDRIPEESKNMLPQNYEIMSFAPFLEDPLYTFELPVGMGCGRKPQKYDVHIPSFEKSSLYVLAEVVYTDSSNSSETSYVSNFMYAMDAASGFVSYHYTPWIGSGENAKAGDHIHVVFDMNDKYLYETNVRDGTCEIKNVEEYLPRCTFPGDNGYISLTGSSIFYPENEFYYLGVGVERGYKVNIFETTYPDGYSLGDRVVKNTIVTHYYLKDNEIKRGPAPVKNALVRIRIALNGDTDKGEMMKAVLNLNLFGFSTQVESQEHIFNISNCFRKDDYMFSAAITGGVGSLLFVTGCFLGGLIMFGVAYFRVNRSW